MTPDERTGPVAGAGPEVTTTTIASVQRHSVAGVEVAARRVRLHHTLVRRPRWTKGLDTALGDLVPRYDPWRDPAFIELHEALTGRRVSA